MEDGPKNIKKINNSFFPTRNTENYVSINHWRGEQNEIALFYITEGYRDATLILLDKILKSESWMTKDSLIYPMLFTFRHYLEISMKDTLRYYRIKNCEVGNSSIGFRSEHSILDLWKDLRSYLPESVGLMEFEHLIYAIESVDRGSFSFRYPFEKAKYSEEAKFIIKGTIRADLDELKKNITYLIEVFDGLNLRAAALMDREL